MERRGVVYISTTAHYMPAARLVDPERSSFHVHWEDPDVPKMLADAGEIVGAEEAITWGRQRCDRDESQCDMLESHYSAGEVPLTKNVNSSWPSLPELASHSATA